jgi:hypothetical protein
MGKSDHKKAERAQREKEKKKREKARYGVSAGFVYFGDSVDGHQVNTHQDDCATLNVQLHAVGLRVKDVEGDGNCLFRCD